MGQKKEMKKDSSNEWDWKHKFSEVIEHNKMSMIIVQNNTGFYIRKQDKAQINSLNLKHRKICKEW